MEDYFVLKHTCNMNDCIYPEPFPLKTKKKNEIQWPEKLYIDDVTSHNQCPGIKLIMMMMMMMWTPT